MFTCERVRVFVCVTEGQSFTVREPLNPNLSMSSSRAHRNSAVQSCSHSCYSRGWWPPKSLNTQRERCLFSFVGGPSDSLPCRAETPRDPCPCPLGIEEFSLESLKEDTSTPQKAFPCRLAKKNHHIATGINNTKKTAVVFWFLFTSCCDHGSFRFKMSCTLRVNNLMAIMLKASCYYILVCFVLDSSALTVGNLNRTYMAIKGWQRRW